MSDEFIPHHSRRKCAECGLVNTGADEQCRRCGTELTEDDEFESEPLAVEPVEQPRKRTLLKRLLWIISATLHSEFGICHYFSVLIGCSRIRLSRLTSPSDCWSKPVSLAKVLRFAS